MVAANVTIETEKASRYLQQLCKHFAHKVDVTFDPNQGSVSFPFGQCEMKADDSKLHVTLECENEDHLQRAMFVVTDHVKRFGFREELSVDWVRADQV